MKSMKTMLVAALVVGSLFVCDTVLFAQAGGGAGAAGGGAGAAGGGARRGGGRAMTSDSMMTRLETALGQTNKLSEAQIPKVKAVFDDQIKKQTALRNDTTVAQADRATKRRDIQTAANDQLKAILTPAQFTIYQSTNQRGNARGGRRGGAAGGGAAGGGAAPAAGN
jgi:hypothetical protein